MNSLREIREARGLTQRELADRLNTSDVSISRYETEERDLSLRIMRRIAEELKVTVGMIAGEGGKSGQHYNSELMLKIIENLVTQLKNGAEELSPTETGEVAVISYDELYDKQNIDSELSTTVANIISFVVTRRNLLSRPRLI